MAMSLEQLQQEYNVIAPLAERFCITLKEQIEELLQGEKLSLGLPIEHRVKKWASIAEKIERNTLTLETITDMQDFVGLRIILLFSRDVAKTCELISSNLTVLDKEDTQTRLGESQFGYQSFHYLVQLPKNWLSVPSLASVGQLKAEIQVRTVAQHIWAAASHVLQYKQESSVPLPVRRSIHRVSALLETVDLEFERVLDARQSYVSSIKLDKPSGPLNVDLLANLLDSLLPQTNKSDSEPYGDLLPELLHFNIDSPQKLQLLVSKHLPRILKEDSDIAKEQVTNEDFDDPISEDRARRGVFFAHAGLVRRILQVEFKDKYYEFISERERKQLSEKRGQSIRKKKAAKKLPR